MVPKTGDFLQLLTLKLPETPVFTQKYLIRYSQDVFAEYMNFKISRYLRQCGIIPVKSSIGVRHGPD
jgi:hypothetical protein